MKRIATLMLLVAASPLTASASAVPIGQTPLQLLTTLAAVEAQEVSLSSGQSLACAALFSAPSVQVGKGVLLAWGSVGAVDPSLSSSSVPMWAPHGGSTMEFSEAGTWTYSFTFYNANNASTTCNAKIVVTK